MSVRRLADESIQPAAFAFSADNQAWAERKIGEYPPGRQQSAVIPLLFRAQEQLGWVSRPAIETVARMLDMAYIRVLEVATFYTQFQLKPVGTKAHIQVCGTTPCMLRGAEELREVCQHKIHHDPFTTTPDGALSWEEVECLGACVNAPLVMVGSDTYEDLTPARLEAIIDDFAAGRPVKPGTQIERRNAAAQSGQTTLTEPPTAARTYKPFPPPPPPAEAPGAAPAAAPPPKPAEPAPTTAARPKDVSIEAAPGIRDGTGTANVSMEKAESERKGAAAAAGATGESNKAMRPDAVGAESAAGKIDGGAAAGKPVKQLFEAPTGAKDDLKLISGVGPVLERTLNAVGITTYAQVAKLTPEQIDAVEAELNFKGRVVRDKWIAQADALATGGAQEYIKRFGKDPR
jgi:NADH-quinone oxidoreductase subunit E